MNPIKQTLNEDTHIRKGYSYTNETFLGARCNSYLILDFIQEYSQKSSKNESSDSETEEAKEAPKLFRFDVAAKKTFEEKISQEKKAKRKKPAPKSKPSTPPVTVKRSDVFLEEFPTAGDILKQTKEKMKKIRQQARREIKQDEYSSPSESEDKPSKSKRKRMKVNTTSECGKKSIRGELIWRIFK